MIRLLFDILIYCVRYVSVILSQECRESIWRIFLKQEGFAFSYHNILFQ